MHVSFGHEAKDSDQYEVWTIQNRVAVPVTVTLTPDEEPRMLLDKFYTTKDKAWKDIDFLNSL
jgi:hypothetical protein